MKKNQDDNSIITSTSKALINDWLALRDIIAKISCTQKEAQEKVNEKPTWLLEVLDDTRINDAFHGPFHPLIAELVAGYIVISKIRARLVITQDDNLKPHVQNADFDLPQDLTKDINAAALDKKQRALDEAARHAWQQWQELIGSWQQNLLMQIGMNEVSLSDAEISEMQQIEPLSELMDRFTELKLELPKMKKPHYQFADYFHLKLVLCIHSALSRQHVVSVDEEIAKVLKKLKPELKKITQQEGELVQQQKTDIETLMRF